MNKFFLLTLLFCSSAQATIYLVARDPHSDAIGLATISSGPVAAGNITVQALKGVGIVGWSGSTEYVDSDVNKVVFELMEKGATEDQIKDKVFEMVGNNYYRYSFISTRGIKGYVFPDQGCHQQFCGVMENDDFFIMGGGLMENTVKNSFSAYETISLEKTPLLCRLMKGLRVISKVGGEMASFRSTKIVVDDPNQTDLTILKAEVPFILPQPRPSGDELEENILLELEAKIKETGTDC